MSELIGGWVAGLTATLIREGINKHRAREIAQGYWEAYCKDDEEVERLRADAERYRFAKDKLRVGRMRYDAMFGSCSCEFEDMDDDAIDAAMKEGK